MKKYLKLAQISLQELFVYRLNFLLWRFRNLVSFLTLIYFWSAIFQDKLIMLGYSKQQIFAYVIGISFLKSLILSTKVADLAGQIKTGELTKIITKPFDMFMYWLTKDCVDKSINLFFTIFEFILIFQIFKLDFYFPQNLVTILVLIAMPVRFMR